MATAALIGGGLLLGGVASGIGSNKIAEANEDAAVIQQQTAQPFVDTANQAQQAQLGLLGQGGDPNAAQNLLSSPLVQAINAQNQQGVNAQANASGISGGNLLTALQNANTATIMQAGFGGLGSIAGQGMQALPGLMQAQGAQGQAIGAQNAMPFLTGANIVNQGTQLAGFGLGGGFGAGTQTAMQNFGNPFASAPAPSVGGGGTLQGMQPVNNFGVL